MTSRTALVVCVSVACSGLAACVDDVSVLEPAEGGVSHAAELWAHDPLRRTVDLRTGEYGFVERDGAVVNRNSHLGFGLPNPGFMEIGIQAHETGVLVDLGTDAELGAALGADSGYVALTRTASGRFGHEPANALFDHLDAIEQGQDVGDASRVVPEVGHVLVGALVQEAGSAEAVQGAIVVKIVVLDHEPDEVLAIRWTVL